jgi:hypothetical protein
MRKLATALLAAMLPAFAFAAPAAAQGVYVDTGPAAFGFGIGPVYDPVYDRNAPVTYDYYYGPGYDTSYYAPVYAYRPAPVYSYTRRVYRPGTYAYRDYTGTRVYGWSSAPDETTVITTARPGNCGTYHYWKDGHCVDARGE